MLRSADLDDVLLGPVAQFGALQGLGVFTSVLSALVH